MSLLHKRQAVSNVDGPLIPSRTPPRTGSVAVTGDSALRHSAVFACCALGADLIGTFPVDTYRNVNGVRVEVPPSPVIVEPGGPGWDMMHWLRASQFDLERAGNAIGLITETNALGLPSRIELQAIGACSVIRRGGSGKLEYRIHGKTYQPEQVWHEKANVVAGLDVGLDPIAYAAWSIGEYLSIQRFALDWFGGGGVPKARLKNTARTLDMKEAGILKDRYNAAISDGDLFVHGNDWEYNFLQAQNAGMEWLEGRRFGLTEICRFFKYPADLIEAAISAPGTLTYQSALTRNLQFLVMQLGPRIRFRENNLSNLLPRPRYVKLNSGVLLAMDPDTQARVIHQRIVDKTLTNTEARALYDRPPLTSAEIAEFETLYGAPRSNVVPASAPASNAGTVTYDRADSIQAAPVRAIATVGEPLDWEENDR